jgi:hypothetical protein
MLMELLISIAIVFRVQIYDSNLLIYDVLLVGLLIGKYFKEGNTVGSVLQYISVICLLLSDICGLAFLMHVGIVLCIFNYFFISPALYTLPVYNGKVGFKDSLGRGENG